MKRTYAGICATSGKSRATAGLRLAKPGTFFVTFMSEKVFPPSVETSQVYGLAAAKQHQLRYSDT